MCGETGLIVSVISNILMPIRLPTHSRHMMARPSRFLVNGESRVHVMRANEPLYMDDLTGLVLIGELPFSNGILHLPVLGGWCGEDILYLSSLYTLSFSGTSSGGCLHKTWMVLKRRLKSNRKGCPRSHSI